MKKKIISLLLATAMTAGVLAGCGDSSDDGETSETSSAGAESTDEDAGDSAQAQDGDVTITFWHSMSGVNGEATEYLVNKFNEENDQGIYVDAQFQGEYDDAINKLKSAQIGNMGADLVQIYEIGTRFMIDSGWTIKMQDLIDEDDYDISVLEENIAAYYSVDGELYSMPFNTSTPILYYNVEVFEKAGLDVPTSMEEIIEISQQLVDTGDVKYSMAMGLYGWFFEQLVYKQGLEYTNNDNGRSAASTAVSFDSNGAALNIMSTWKDLYDTGLVPTLGTGSAGSDEGITEFVTGNAAMTLGSTASLKQILTDVDGNFEVGTAYFPSVYESDEGGVSVGGASLWALNNEDPEKEAATWEFIKFLISAESQAYWNAETGYFPVTTTAHEEEVFLENIEEYPQFMTAIDQLHDSSPESAGAFLSVFPEARNMIEQGLENVLSGNLTPEEGVTKITEDVNGAIEDYNLVNE